MYEVGTSCRSKGGELELYQLPNRMAPNFGVNRASDILMDVKQHVCNFTFVGIIDILCMIVPPL